MKIVESHKAPKQKTPVRLSDYAVGIFTSIVSKKGIKKAISKKLIQVNGKTEGTGKFIHGGENITLHKPKPKVHPTVDLKLEVIFEDDSLAIVNKPAGLVVSGNKLRTLENALSSNLTQSNSNDALERPQPVHRLDFPTSGLLIISKTAACSKELGRLFELKEIQKTYHAVTIGKMDKEGQVDSDINGKTAFTKYTCLKSMPSDKFECLNLLKLHPTTGRRHQLRIHLHALDNPILGDNKYYIDKKVLKGKGLFLHASGLEFIHPITEEKLSFNIDLPAKFFKLFPQEGA